MKIAREEPHKLQSKQVKPLKKSQSMEKVDKSIGDWVALIADALSGMDLQNNIHDQKYNHGYYYRQPFVNPRRNHQEKNLNILKTKSAFKMK